jgi:hypothetical protein
LKSDNDRKSVDDSTAEEEFVPDKKFSVSKSKIDLSICWASEENDDEKLVVEGEGVVVLRREVSREGIVWVSLLFGIAGVVVNMRSRTWSSLTIWNSDDAGEVILLGGSRVLFSSSTCAVLVLLLPLLLSSEEGELNTNVCCVGGAETWNCRGCSREEESVVVVV